MTKTEAIHRRVLRCRPGHSNAYVTTHEALLAEAEYLQQTQRRSLWQIIKGWFA